MNTLVRSCRWLAAALPACALDAQVVWSRADLIDSRYVHAMTYDVARGVLVAFGGENAAGLLGDTIEHDGTQWRRRSPAQSPAPRRGHAMAYDAGRQRTVLFGGSGAISPLRDTWEWDGTNWVQRTPATQPNSTSGQVMAYDFARGRTVLFAAPVAAIGTWEWDGTNWLQRSPAQSPQAHGAMAYDVLRQRTVLFDYLGETWEWDGANWTQQFPAASPNVFTSGLAYDVLRGRTVLLGYDAGSAPQTWEWDGSNWTQLAPPLQPRFRASFPLAYDLGRGRTVLFGGGDGGGVPRTLADTWEWDGSGWTERSPGVPVAAAPMAFDAVRARSVLVGDGSNGPLSGIWEWDGTTWTRRAPIGGSPPPRGDFAIAADNGRGRVLLFGGVTGGFPSYQLFGDTWEWNGAAWSLRTPPVSPTARHGEALAYDDTRARVLLLGGEALFGVPLGDFWAWDGTTWQQLPSAPPPRRASAMAHDAARGRTLLFGGSGAGGGALADTWEWDGAAWTQRNPPQSPTARSGHAMVFDVARQRVVLFGGPDANTWEWDGGDWLLRAPLQSPSPRQGAAFAYDAARSRVVLFGGSGRADTWEYQPIDPARYTTFGAGCGGSNGVPALAPLGGGLPWIGSTLAVAIANLPLGLPAAATVGSSNRSWAGLQLPLDLAFLGMPGCSLLGSGEVVLPLATSNGGAALRVPIPNASSLVRGVFYDQAFAIDPTANAFGVITSNGGEAVIGAR